MRWLIFISPHIPAANVPPPTEPPRYTRTLKSGPPDKNLRPIPRCGLDRLPVVCCHVLSIQSITARINNAATCGTIAFPYPFSRPLRLPLARRRNWVSSLEVLFPGREFVSGEMTAAFSTKAEDHERDAASAMSDDSSRREFGYSPLGCLTNPRSHGEHADSCLIHNTRNFPQSIFGRPLSSWFPTSRPCSASWSKKESRTSGE